MNILTCNIRVAVADVIASSFVLRAFDVSLFEFTVSRTNHIMLPIDKIPSSVCPRDLFSIGARVMS